MTSVLFTAAAASAATMNPMITTNWQQSGNGYNDQTLEFDSQRAPTGCLSVAFGQVMKYFNYPRRGIGSTSYCNNGGYRCDDELRVEASFYETIYDWENMPDALGELSTEAEKNAVSQLLKHVGAAVGVRYGKDGSAAPLDNPAVFKGLSKAFNMANAYRKAKEDFSSSEWQELIKNEVLAGSPVVLTGTDSKVNAGHAYVVDGVREDGMVHINVGWGGYANGWYDLDDIAIARRYRFTEGMAAYLGLRPKQHVAGEQCAGRYGAQCAEGLNCVVTETGAEAYGTCMSGDTEEPELEVKQKTFDFSGTVAKGKEIHYGPFTSLDEVIVDMQGTGDADLYVQVGVKPTPSGFSCRPYKSGSSEECVVDGTNEEVFVMVSGYAPSSDYTVTVFTTEFSN